MSLRQLIDEFATLEELTAYLDANTECISTPAPTPAPPQPQEQAYPQPMQAIPQAQPYMYPMMPMPTQMQPGQMPGMPAQMMPVYFYPMAAPPQQQVIPQQPVQSQPVPKPDLVVEPKQVAPAAKPVSGPTTAIDRSNDNDDLTSDQQAHIDQLITRYTDKTKGSKALTQKYRKFHADPRTASGFNRAWKEMVYQIVTTESKGSRLLDVDGNEYIDILNGFGPGFLGHCADFLVEAVEKQLHKSYEVGPQCLLAMEAAELFCEVTGNERTSFVCTGSEAVQAAMRLARTVTNRDKIVIFARDYHGNFDEVLVRGVNSNGNFKSLPTAPGIPKASAGNMIVLPYGTDESLEIIRQMADDLAAVIVEPVQSRRPEFRPREFIREVRSITERSGTLFVFDEVVTGFRFGPRGAQEFYGVEADLCTYGKVIGGGMPLGVVSGKAEFMDTFDGGMWQYGDDSFPESPVTFFAGTFVRHPLAMASVKAMLEFFKQQPPHFWNQINDKGDKLAGTVHQFFQDNGIPMEMPNCGSLMFVRMGENQKYGNLFFYHLREKGIFMLEGFPSYMTAAHSDEDIDYAIDAFKESAFEMQSAGFFKPSKESRGFTGFQLQGPPPRLSAVDVKPSDIGLSPLVAPTTAQQQEILVASRLDERASCAFNESASLTFKGDLNVDALEKAFQQMVQRHDALRATFSKDGLSMTIHPNRKIEIEKVDLRGKGEEHLNVLLHIDASTPYDLDDGALIRPILIQKSDDEHIFIISAHHLVCDGWSYNVMAEELAEVYNAECENRLPALPFAKQYVDYAREQEKFCADSQHAKQEQYWLDQFKDIPENIELPLDRAYRSDRTFKGNTIEHRINKETYTAIKKAGVKQGSTLYSTLLAAYKLLIHRLTGQDDIVVCIPAAGQTGGENTDNLIGHCVNFLPLRSYYNGKEEFPKFLSQSRKTLLNATDHSSFTYGELIQKLDIERDPRRLPLLEVAFNVERMDYFGDWNDLDVVFEPNGKTHVHYTMFMNIVESTNGLRIDVDYNTDVLDEQTVRAWIGHFETLIGSIIAQSNGSVAQLSLLSEDDRKLLTEKWSNQSTKQPFPNKMVHHLFEEMVEDSPKEIALLNEQYLIDYRKLNEHANAISTALRELGVTPGDFVAIWAQRSAETVAALLGILKTGAAYVPIDPTYPEDRIALMLEDCEAQVVLVDGDFASEGQYKILSLADAIETNVPHDYQSYQGDPEDLAYAMYTSGSTGRPKGTLIPHRAIVRLVKNTSYMDFGCEQTFLLAAPISFDASTLELWGPLLNGGQLALLPAGNPSLKDIGDAIEKHEVTSLWLTSGLFSLMVDERPDDLRPLKQLLSGGDVLSRTHVEKALKIIGEGSSLINGYGPTENTTFTACHTITQDDLEQNSIPIGRPISHTQCYILDNDMQPVPVGVKGRLYIGGDGLSIGYLNKPELTLEKFVSSPFAGQSDQRLYDSGDECRWLRDGTIEFIGRADRQVKLRGFRIEPAEIESVLAKHSAIAEAVVQVVGEGAGDKQLIGYLVHRPNETPESQEIRDYAESLLPGYMVPAQIHILSEFPVTTNGKIDYKALAQISAQAGATESKYNDQLPTTETEIRLAKLWDEVLGCGEIGVNADFFKLGGHSLVGLKLFTRIQNEFEKELPLATLFQNPTVKLLGQVLDQSQGSDQLKIVTPVSFGSGDDIPLFLLHGGDGGTLFYKKFIENINGFGEIYTIEAPMAVNRSIVHLEPSIEKTAALYLEQIRDHFQGTKVAVGGYSFGGVLALELARQLREQNTNVESLFLFDTNNPSNEAEYRNNFINSVRSTWEQIDGFDISSKLQNFRDKMGSRIRQKHNMIQTTVDIKKHQKEDLEMDDFLRMAYINREHHKLMFKYIPKVYEGETYLFRGKSSRYAFDREMGWKEVLPNLTVLDIEGHHQDIFDSPYVEKLIERFNELMSLYA